MHLAMGLATVATLWFAAVGYCARVQLPQDAQAGTKALLMLDQLNPWSDAAFVAIADHVWHTIPAMGSSYLDVAYGYAAAAHQRTQNPTWLARSAWIAAHRLAPPSSKLQSP